MSQENDYVTPEFLEQLKDFLNRGGHKYKTVQTKVCLFVIERIYRRVKLGYGKHFGAVKINIEENLIIDGNHRYIAYEMAGFKYEVVPNNKNYCDKPPYNEITDFIVDHEIDWDMGHISTQKFCNDDFLEDLDIEK